MQRDSVNSMPPKIAYLNSEIGMFRSVEVGRLVDGGFNTPMHIHSSITRN